MMGQGLLGIAAFLLIAWLLSERREAVSLRAVGIGLIVQFTLALVFLKLSVAQELFLSLNQVVLALEQSTQAGSAFVFGYLAGGPLPFAENGTASTFILAFRALPLLLVISALSSLLFYWRILPVVVNFFSLVLQKTLRLGGAEGLGVAANIFMGMVEAPLIIRPYLGRLTRSELFTVLTSGMATIAGTVMVLYASILRDVLPNGLGHILTASILNAPAAVLISKIMLPEAEALTSGKLTDPEPAQNSMDAITQGTLRGIQLLFNIVAMLIVLVALVNLSNVLLALLPDLAGGPLTLERIFGWLMAPVVWLMGVPWSEAGVAGGLMGTKTIINELVAYLNLSQLPKGALSPHSLLIMTYAMCGFANPGSVGILIGGMGTLVPERREEIVALGIKTIVAGTLATCLTGTIVGLLT